MVKQYRLIKNSIDMSYFVVTPDGYDINKKYPLVVALHGTGTFGKTPREAFDSSIAYEGYKKFNPETVMLFPVSPYAAWSSQIKELKYIIDLVCDRYNIDMMRVSIVGGSMGGCGMWNMITEYPHFFAAASPICSREMAWAAERIANMPIWIYHGGNDNVVLPERSEEMYERIVSINPNNKDLHYTVVENTGHDSWNKAYLEDNIIGWLISHKKKTFDVYVGSQTADGGIYRYKLTDGKLTFCEKYDEAGVSYLQIKRNKMYVTVNQELTKQGGVVCYDMDGERLKNRSALYNSYGKSCCHIQIDDSRNIYMVNYLDGNVVKLNMDSGETELVYHKGDGINKPRQDKEHTHQIAFTPDGKFFAVCDLGTDIIHIYDFDMKEVSKVHAVPGSGPRHILFADDEKLAYCVNELDNTVTVYAYSEGVLTRLESYNMLPFGYPDLTTAAAIRINGKYLYASTRGHDSITRFEICGDILKYVDNTKVEGKRPRDFNVSPDGKHLICANEGGEGNITLFNILEDGSLEYTGTEFNVPGALCVIFA